MIDHVIVADDTGDDEISYPNDVQRSKGIARVITTLEAVDNGERLLLVFPIIQETNH